MNSSIRLTIIYIIEKNTDDLVISYPAITNIENMYEKNIERS